MSEPQFDPGGFYQFDLARGAVNTRDGHRMLVLSDSVVAPLVSAAVQNGDLTAVRQLGKQIGEHVLAALDGEVEGASPEAVLGHAASVVAIMGWGRLTFERWGDALVAIVEELPTLDPESLGVAALLGGIFSMIARREVACVPVDARRFLVVDPAIAEQVWRWAKDGWDLGAIVSRLTRGDA